MTRSIVKENIVESRIFDKEAMLEANKFTYFANRELIEYSKRNNTKKLKV